MVTSDSKSASGLQMVRRMKAVAVVIVAMLALTGCGVGQGEYWDGEKLVDSNGEALEFDGPAADSASNKVADAAAAQTSITTGVEGCSGVRDPGAVSLPQDPIPVQPYPLDAFGMPMLPTLPQGGMPPMSNGVPPPKY